MMRVRHHDDLCVTCLDDGTRQEVLGDCGECWEATIQLDGVDAHRYFMEYAPHVAMAVVG